MAGAKTKQENPCKWWCFTLNNPGLAEEILIRRWVDRDDKFKAKYLIYQQEIGEKDGTPHLQGTVCFEHKHRLTGLKTLNPRAHWSKTNDIDKSIEYCKKLETRAPGNTPFEAGTYDKKGKRNDLLALKRHLDEHDTWDTILEENFALAARHHKFITTEINRRAAKRDFETKVIVITGDAGIGKTRFAHRFCELRGLKLYNFNYGNQGNNWFDDYKPGECILFDDFYGGIPHSLFLRVCDRYECHVECKGGRIQLTPPVIFITSNKKWDQWYDWSKVSQSAVERRITMVIHCTYEVHEGEEVPSAKVSGNTGGHLALIDEKASMDGTLMDLVNHMDVYNNIGLENDMKGKVDESAPAASSPPEPVTLPTTPIPIPNP